MNEYLTCTICGRVFKSKISFCLHINREHRMSVKDYYDTYFKKPNDGICKVCGKSTRFYNIWDGYAAYCSPGCIPKDPDIQEKMKQTCRKHFGTDYAFQAEEVKD